MPTKADDASPNVTCTALRDAIVAEPLDVFSGTGGVLMWNGSDAMRLRTEHGIMGDFVGTMPRHTAQNQYLSIPLALSEEEFLQGHAHGILRLLRDTSSDYALPDNSQCNKFYKARDSEIEQCAAQSVASQKARRPVRVQPQVEQQPSKSRKRPRTDEQDNRPRKSQKTNAGVRVFLRSLLNRVVGVVSSLFLSTQARRLEAREPSHDSGENENISTREVVTDNTSRLLKQARASASIQTICEAKGGERLEPVQIAKTVLNGRGGDRKAHSQAFGGLRKRGYTVTCGAKFGADYLAYAGDPSLFHGSLAVILADDNGLMPLRELVAVGRLSDSTRKRAIWVLDDGRTLGVQWEENLP